MTIDKIDVALSDKGAQDKRSGHGRSPGQILECYIYKTEAEVEALADDWRNLHAVAGYAPFTDYDWFYAWWRHIGKRNDTLHVAVGYDGKARLVAILPLVVTLKMGMRILRNAGLGGGFPCDVISENPNHADALWQTVRESRGYDFAIVGNVDAGSFCNQALTSFAQYQRTEKLPYLRFAVKDSQAWLASLSSHARSQYKRHTRRLNENGAIRYCICTTAPAPAHVIDDMIGLKTAWCIKSGKERIVDQPGFAEFLHNLVEIAAGQGRLFLGWIQNENRLIAGLVGFLYRDTFHFYMISHDSEWGQFSPGNLVLVNAINWSIDRGFREFDFMQGDEAYKLRYANGIRDYTEWGFSTRLSGSLKKNAYFALRALRRKTGRNRGKTGGA